MNFENIFGAVMVSDGDSLGVIDIAGGMGLAFFLSMVVALVYMHTQKHFSHSTSFVHSIFLFAVLTTVITMLIGDNVARAFGLVGALSIIRFRNSLKDTIDAVYIFWSLAIGLACGSGLYLMALVMVPICAAMAMILHLFKIGYSKNHSSILKVKVEEKNEASIVETMVNKIQEKSVRFRQLNILSNSNLLEKTYIFSVTARKSPDLTSLGEQLREIEGVKGLEQLSNESPLFLS